VNLAILVGRLASVSSWRNWYVTRRGRRPGAGGGHPGIDQVSCACEMVRINPHVLGRILAVADIPNRLRAQA